MKLPSAYETEMWMTLSEFSPCVLKKKENSKRKRRMKGECATTSSSFRYSNLI
jgi:hypothetical protein